MVYRNTRSHTRASRASAQDNSNNPPSQSNSNDPPSHSDEEFYSLPDSITENSSIMAGRIFIVKLQNGFKIQDLSKLAVNISEWRDATEKDIKQFGSSSAYDYRCLQDWKHQLNGFLRLVPLDYALEGTTDWKPLFELATEENHFLNDDYILDAICNYVDGDVTDPSKDAIKLDRDGLLHSTIGMRLFGHKSLDWLHRSPYERQQSRLATGLKNIRETILGSIVNVRSEARDRFESLFWDDKTTLSTYREKFKNSFNLCTNLGMQIDFDTAKRAWMRGITKDRSSMTFLQIPLDNPYVVQAIQRKDVFDFTLQYCESLKKYLKSDDQTQKFSRGEGAPALNFSQFSSGPGQWNGRQRGRGNRGGRGNGRGGRGNGGRGLGSHGHQRGRGNRDRQFNSGQSSSACGNCGSMHQRGQCPARGQTCFNCNKVGHFASVCRSSPSQNSRNHQQQFSTNTQHQSHQFNTQQQNPIPQFSTDTQLPQTSRSSRDGSVGIPQQPPTQYSNFNSHQHNIPNSAPPRLYNYSTVVDVSEPIDVAVDTLYPSDEDELQVGSPFHPDDDLFVVKPSTPQSEVPSVAVNSDHSGIVAQTSQDSEIPYGFAIYDCAANRHSLPTTDGFITYHPMKAKVFTNGGTYTTAGQGDARFVTLDFDGNPVPIPLLEASHAPRTNKTIVSSCSLEDLGYDMCSGPSGRYITNGTSHIPLYRWNNILLIRMVGQGEPPEVLRPPLDYSTVEETRVSHQLFHRRQLHLGNEINLRTAELYRKQLIDDLRRDGSGKVIVDEPCAVGKMRREKLRVDSSLKQTPTEPFEILQMDYLINSVEAIGGYRQSIILVDAKGSFVANFNTKTKRASEVIRHLQAFFRDFRAPRILVIDRDSPFVSQELEKFCSDSGVKLYPVPTARHELNGLVERTIGTLRNMVRCALSDSRLPTSFWAFALDHAVYVLNRSASRKYDWSSPALQVGLPRANLDFNRVFGCLVFYRVVNPDKLGPRARPGVFVGVESTGTHATYKIYDFNSSRLITRYIQDITFDEFETWASHSAKRGELPVPPSEPSRYFDPHKGIPPAERVDHDLFPPEEDLVMATYLSDSDIRLLAEPTQHIRKRASPQSIKKRVEKLRADAVKNDEPLSFHDIDGRHDADLWYEACQKEDQSHVERGTVELIHESQLPPNADVAGCRRVFKRKRDGRRKVRNVFQGHTQKTRLLDDFSSPAVSLISFMICLKIAVCRGWSFATFDIETAFLNAVLPLNPPVFMRLPEGHSHKGRGFVARLRKAIYGMKEAGRLFFNMLIKILISFSLCQSSYDPCVFFGTDLFVLIYVDDCLLLGEPEAIQRVLDLMKMHFNITHTGINEDVDFIGCDLSWKDGSICLSQQKYIERLLQKLDAVGCKEFDSPAPEGTILYPSEQRLDFPLRSWVGAIAHCRVTRPDILFMLNQLSRVLHAVGDEAISAAQRLVGYLKKTKKIKIVISPCPLPELKLSAFSDAEWAANVITRKSTGGHVIYFGNTPIAAVCKMQSVVAPSTQASELIQMYVAGKQIVWIKDMIAEMKMTPSDYAVPIATDSATTLKAIKILTDKSKHVGVYSAYLRMLVEKGIVTCHKVLRSFNPADIFTKQATKAEFFALRKMLFDGVSVTFSKNA